MSDELEKRLDTGMYGTPRVNPDEQRKYLGTFRERCYLSMTVTEMKKIARIDPDRLHHFTDQTTDGISDRLRCPRCRSRQYRLADCWERRRQ